MNTLQLAPEQDRSATFRGPPVSGDEVPIHRPSRELTLSKIVGLIDGSASQSVTFSLFYGTDITAAGTLILTETTTNNTGGEEFTSFTNGVIPADNVMWAVLTTVSGTVISFMVTAVFE